MKKITALLVCITLFTPWLTHAQSDSLKILRENAEDYLERAIPPDRIPYPDESYKFIEENWFIGSPMDTDSVEFAGSTIRSYTFDSPYLLLYTSEDKVGKKPRLIINLCTDTISLFKGKEKTHIDHIKINQLFLNATYETGGELNKITRTEIKKQNIDRTNYMYTQLVNLQRAVCNDPSKTDISQFKTEATSGRYPNEMSEEQRKYIVQANAANEKKDYELALELYNKAVDINPYSYPDAYFNMAFIYAHLQKYFSAMDSMKKYLILQPDSKDARAAQDQIYEWEMNIN